MESIGQCMKKIKNKALNAENILHNMLYLRSMLNHLLLSLLLKIEILEMFYKNTLNSNRIITPLPLFHIFHFNIPKI